MVYFNNNIKILCLLIIISPISVFGQDYQLNSAATWLFNPAWYNPAISGSKDFNSLNILYATGDDYNSIVVNGNSRLTRNIEGYSYMSNHYEYSNIGLGYHGFYRSGEKQQSTGIKASGSYHFSLNENSLSFLSIGLSLQGSYDVKDIQPDDENPDSTISESSFMPNADFGIYYYSPNIFAGLSATGLLEGVTGDSLNLSPDTRCFHLFGGYKFLVYRPINLIIEPSLIISIPDSSFSNIPDNIYAALKVYIDNFCLGTYYYNKDKLSFFFKYNYPRFYLGGFLAINRKSPYYKKIPSLEIYAGINLSYNKSSKYKRYHW